MCADLIVSDRFDRSRAPLVGVLCGSAALALVLVPAINSSGEQLRSVEWTIFVISTAASVVWCTREFARLTRPAIEISPQEIVSRLDYWANEHRIAISEVESA